MSPKDPFELARFQKAQDAHGTYGQALDELRTGTKQSHWMWFVFPQLAGLGHSETARYYGLRSLDEARAYRGHPVLGPRLLECAGIVAGLEGRAAADLFGDIDALKLRSSMTLFHRAAPDEPLFSRVLATYFEGEGDPLTDQLLATTTGP
ncbi:MAG TPA: DUF1810 domain-containing protein [Acidimicrobiales bacterium]|jgi:uncharacterized protein (DUF1810 family)